MTIYLITWITKTLISKYLLINPRSFQWCQTKAEWYENIELTEDQNYEDPFAPMVQYYVNNMKATAQQAIAEYKPENAEDVNWPWLTNVSSFLMPRYHQISFLGFAACF